MKKIIRGKVYERVKKDQLLPRFGNYIIPLKEESDPRLGKTGFWTVLVVEKQEETYLLNILINDYFKPIDE